MKRETGRTGVIVCSCGGTLFAEPAGERLTAEIAAAAGDGPPPVFFPHAGACSAGGLRSLRAALARQGIGKAVFAGCSLLERADLVDGLAHRGGLTPSAIRGVNLRQPLFRRLAGEEAIGRAAAAVRRALQALALQPSFHRRRIPLAPGVLVIGAGPAAVEAAARVRALGHETTLATASPAAGADGLPSAELPETRSVSSTRSVARRHASPGVRVLARSRLVALDGRVGAFTARLQGDDGATTVTAGALIIAGAAGGTESAGSGPDGTAAPGAALPAAVVPLAELAAAAAALPRRRGVRSIGILLDLEIDESRASMETALLTALDLQSPGRVQVYLLCRDARVSALPLEQLYGRAREAGVQIVKYTGTPCVADDARSSADGTAPGADGAHGSAAPSAVTVTLRDSILGAEVRLDLDRLGVSPRGLRPAASDCAYAARLAPASDYAYAARLARVAGLSTDRLGRMQENNVHLFPNGSNRPGIFLVGPARGEDWLPQALREARAAALAAHELLASGYLWIELSHPVVDADKCALCLTCIRSCPFQAMRIDVERQVAESLPEVCQRCGICAGECPAKAIELPVYSDRILLAQID